MQFLELFKNQCCDVQKILNPISKYHVKMETIKVLYNFTGIYYISFYTSYLLYFRFSLLVDMSVTFEGGIKDFTLTIY